MNDYFDDALLDDVFIKDLNVLKPEYQPDDIDEREDELDEYIDHLSPVLKGWDTENIFLYGEAGVGKTLATRILLPRLQDKADENGVNLEIVEANCSGVSSSYQAAIQVINEMYEPKSLLTSINLKKNKLKNTGYPSQAIFQDKLHEALGDVDTDYLILILDEVDGIGNDGELFYQLTRSESMGKISYEICIIGISNNLYWKDTLKKSVKDTLCESEIHFPEYNSDELISILKRRTELAFFEDTCEDGVIELCAGLASNKGSARYGIRLIRKAARIAENSYHDGNDVSKITRKHVRNAEREIEQQTIKAGIKKLGDTQLYILFVIASIHAKNNTPCATSKIFKYYEISVKRDQKNPKSRKTVYNNLLSMVDKGIIKITNGARNERGVPNRYTLVTEIEIVINALESAVEVEFNLDDLRETAEKHGVIEF